MSNETMSIVTTIANSIKATAHPKYVNTPFESFAELSPNTKGKLVQAMVSEILTKDGHEVHDSINVQHDLRVKFNGENHRTKLEIKSAMYKRASDKMSTGQFNLAHDFDELLIVLLYPDSIKAYRVNRSILRGMEKNGIFNTSKEAKMFGDITAEILESYDSIRVF